MNNYTNLQEESVTIWQEKIIEQNKPDALSEKKVDTLPTPTQVAQEEKVADTKKRLDENIVKGLVKRSNRILVSIRSHALPFDFFPDVINVEDGRITIVIRQAFSSEIHSVDIKDISNVFINTSFLFSQLVIVSNTFEDNQCEIRNLRKKESVYVRRIIEGLRVFVSKGIDTSSYTKTELVAKLEELSTTEIVT
jgi:hypothetical protein